MQANFIIDLGDKAHVPIISFSATSPSLSSIRSQYFIRANQNDSVQIKAISGIVQAFGWREAVPIYVDNEFGEGIIPSLTDALQEIDTRVPYRSLIPPSATDDEIVAELYKLMSMQTRVFIVHMLPSLGSRLFIKAREIGMMSEGFVWIITNELTNGLSSMDSSVIESMEGIIGVKPHVPRTPRLKNFTIRWKRKFHMNNPDMINVESNTFGLWAYDSVTALAIAVEKVGATNFGFQKSNTSGNTTTDLETFGVSQTGLSLVQALQSTTFRGLSGDFRLLNGQLQSFAYQIVNVIGIGSRGIGFWTSGNGIVRELNFSNTNKTYTNTTTSKACLGSIIWPGDTKSPPEGWVIPTNGRKKLKIGVPVKDGFREFVEVIRNPSKNTTTVKGYCIDVFDAVMDAIPHKVLYEYIPFATPDGKSAGTYDDMVYQVNQGEFHGVVGDTTIIANRSQYVDFTLPYTESGVTMIVPIKDNGRKNTWIFLKPLTWDLWATSFCSFVFIGFAIWVLEHRINEDFRGPPSHQVGTILWFSFSTMVFSHRERVVSNLARFVLIIWFFVVLILTQSYTASLTSMLTVQQLQPTITDLKELIRENKYVGYHNGSFVFGLLQMMNFDKSKLKAFDSVEELHELFSEGNGNGAIAAAFDEIPYMKFFLSQYCSQYTMVEPTYKTGGFGFVFPIGSPLVQHVSRAILNVTQGDKMIEIEKTWLDKKSCRDSNTLLSSNSLGLDSFRGLFLIAGIASVSTLVIFAAFFIRDEHSNLVNYIDTKASIWIKIVSLARCYDKKDLTCHTFRKSELRDRNNIDNMERIGAMEASPCMNCLPSPSSFTLNGSPITIYPPSPSSVSNHTDESFRSAGENGNPSHEFGDPNQHGQTCQEIMSVIELGSRNEDGPRTLESTTDNHYK